MQDMCAQCMQNLLIMGLSAIHCGFTHSHRIQRTGIEFSSAVSPPGAHSHPPSSLLPLRYASMLGATNGMCPLPVNTSNTNSSADTCAGPSLPPARSLRWNWNTRPSLPKSWVPCATCTGASSLLPWMNPSLMTAPVPLMTDASSNRKPGLHGSPRISTRVHCGCARLDTVTLPCVHSVGASQLGLQATQKSWTRSRSMSAWACVSLWPWTEVTQNTSRATPSTVSITACCTRTPRPFKTHAMVRRRPG
mmetsp:Transcript_15249/g.38011  ORF Transcript_15249/g.38011 Transcript_15249/m.38011 type:complete len:249 (+) Transcript_15249:1371-2117(+)